MCSNFTLYSGIGDYESSKCAGHETELGVTSSVCVLLPCHETVVIHKLCLCIFDLAELGLTSYGCALLFCHMQVFMRLHLAILTGLQCMVCSL